jgi:hypothetical protein
MIYAKTLGDIERAAKTPAGGGDITPAPAVPATSMEARSTVGDAGVVEQRTADDSPLSVGSDENMLNPFSLAWSKEDDSDQHAFPRSRRLICSVSSDGQTTVHRFGSVGIVLTAEETNLVYEFLAHTARIWSAAT